jgi:hypothetical protein
MGEHYECKGGGDAAAYALGALDERELNGFRRHLDTCSVCQAEVESLARLTDVLPMSAPQFPAPPALRRRVMADVKADARRQRAAREFSTSRTFGGLRAGGLRAGQGLSQLVGPPRRAGLIGGAVAVVLILAVVLVNVTASGSSPTGGRAGTRIVSASVGHGQVYITGQRGQLIVHQLQPVSIAQTYEVWKKYANGSVQPTNALFNTSATGDDAVKLPGSLQGVQEILVTEEAAGGSAIPHGKPVVVARLG